MRDKELLDFRERSELKSLLPTFDIHSRLQLDCGEKVRMRGTDYDSNFRQWKSSRLHCSLHPGPTSFLIEVWCVGYLCLVELRGF